MLEAGGCTGLVLRAALRVGWDPCCPVSPASVRGAVSPGLAVARLSGALRVLRWWVWSTRVQGSDNPQDGAEGSSCGAELGRAGKGLRGPPRAPCLPTGSMEPGLAWGPWAGPMRVGWGTGTVPSRASWLLAGVSGVP